MHRAIIVPSRYPEESGYPNQASWTVNAELLAEKLEGVGYQIHDLAPGEGLVRKLRAILREPDKTQSLLVYFTGYMVLTDQGEPALVLSDEMATALRLSQLAERAGNNFGRVQFVIDAVRGTPSRTVIATTLGRTFASSEHALATLAGEVAVPQNVGLLVGVRRWGDDDLAGLALSEVVDAAIHELSTSTEPANSRDFVDWISERQSLSSFALAAQHSEPEFVVLPRRRFPSIPHGVIPAQPVASPTILAPAHAPSSSVPPPLPGEREQSAWEQGSAWNQEPAPAAWISSAPPALPALSPLNGERTVPPPPPLPVSPAGGFVLPYAPTVPFHTVESLKPSMPAAPPLPSLPPISTFPQPPAVIAAPPPLPFLAITGNPHPNHPPPPLAVAPPILPLLSVSILPPPPLPGTPMTVPAPAWPESWAPSEPIATLPAERPPSLPPPAPEPPSSLPPPPPERPSLAAPPPVPVAEAWPSIAPQMVTTESWGPPEPHPPSSESNDEATFLRRAQRALERGSSSEALLAAEHCLQLFPDSVQALQIAALELAKQNRWHDLAALYEQLVGALQDPSSAAQLCGAAARVYREQLGDIPAARSVLLRGLGLAPTHPNVLLELAELEQLLGNLEAASTLSRRALEANPLSARACRVAQERFVACEQHEWSRTVAIILTFLGQAGAAEAELLQATQSANLPQPTRGLAGTDFKLGLGIGDFDAGLTQVFSILAEPARELALPKPKAQQRLLDGLKEEDVERSTATLIRAFGWTCRFLSMSPPQIYLTDGDALPQLLPIQRVAWGVGRGVGRGMSLTELAFIWGRSLGRARPESRVLFVCADEPAHRELLSALRAAVDLPGEYPGPVKQLAKALRKRVAQPVWELVHQTLSGRSPHQLLHDLARFRAQAEMAANRVGLVACGDLEVALRTLERLPFSNGLSREAQASDLFSYALSDAYVELRRQLGLLS